MNRSVYSRDDLRAAGSPVTYRMLHEDAAGMGLAGEFFTVSGINPDASVKCNCKWDEGHEEHCDLVAANELRRRMNI